MKSRFFSAFLASLIFLYPNQTFSFDKIGLMGFGWCSCVINASFVNTTADRVIVTDKNLGMMYLFTHEGKFAGGLGGSGKCEKNYDLDPISVTYAQNQIFVCCGVKNTIKSFTLDGVKTSEIDPAEIGFEGKKPRCMAAGDNYNYVLFEGGPICVFEKDYTLQKKLDKNPKAIHFKNGKLYALFDNKIFVYNEELVKESEISTEIPGFESNPKDFAVDDDDSIWIADKDFVSVRFKQGGYRFWGKQAFGFGQLEPGESLIKGRSSQVNPTSIDVAENNFFIAQTPGKTAMSIPKSFVSPRWRDLSQAHLAIRLKAYDDRKLIQNVWTLGQLLYPKCAVTVELSGFNSLSINGKMTASGDTALRFLQNPYTLAETLSNQLISNYTPRKIDVDQRNISVDAKGIDGVRLVVAYLKGSLLPFFMKTQSVFLPDKDGKISAKYTLPQEPDALLMMLLSKDGRCYGFRYIEE